MKVFKFGGASVKDAAAVRNVATILQRYSGEKLVVVISAMGKMTNALEKLHEARFHKNETENIFLEIKKFHQSITNDLFGATPELPEPVQTQMDALRDAVMSSPSRNYDKEYDKIVSFGELISTALIHTFLVHEGLPVAWVDARQVIRTDNNFRQARIDWNRSTMGAHRIREIFQKKDVVIIQGFIGSDATHQSTTLGREGSDFTAAVMAFLLDAESVTIWKDVPGMLNADPKWFENTVKLDRISFREAVELAYYGASVIHPKTIKPLQNKNIPLFIKSFLDPEAEGSMIQQDMDYDHLVPSFIFKPGQVLLSISTRDFSFVAEDNLREIFEILSGLGIRINLMENSAISFSICIDKEDYKFAQLLERLQDKYEVLYNENLLLLTIRHYDEATIKKLTEGKEVLVEERTRQTVRMVLR